MNESASSNSTTDIGSEVLVALKASVAQARKSRLYSESLRDLPLDSYDDFRKIPLTTRADLERAGLHGTRAAPLEEICHYGMSSGTTGNVNSTWLTPHDLANNARAIKDRHPDIFAPGKILINRFPFMAAPAHLIQLIAQQGGGISIPAGNINWDVPYPKALDLSIAVGTSVLAGLPLEPIVLGQIARMRGLDPAKDVPIDTFFLGGAPLPPILQRRIEREWDAKVVELYGSTETMLLGTACPERTLHIETDLVFCEILCVDSDEPAAVGEEGRLIVTNLGIQGSPLIRLDTGDRVRRLGPCPCGDPRLSLIVLGRAVDVAEIEGRRLFSYELIEAAAAAADELDSGVFFTVILPDRLVVRIETERMTGGDPEGAIRAHLGDLRVEIERVPANSVLDVEHLSRSPSVYKPVMLTDWRRPGRRLISITQSMMEWPKLSGGEAIRWALRSLRASFRARKLARELRRSK
jgi:phenylacetate-coenzyme A ligase PaaK-like adenylate-forming protein